MGFSFGKFLKRAINPFSAIKDTASAIKNRDLKGFAAATIPGVGATQSALRGDWKGALGRMANPMGEMASAAEGLGGGGPQQSFAKAGGPQEAFAQAPEMASMKGGSMGPGVGSFRRMGGGQPSFGGGFGGFGRFGGMDEGLQKIIQDYYRNKRGGGGGGMMGGGGFSQFGG